MICDGAQMVPFTPPCDARHFQAVNQPGRWRLSTTCKLGRANVFSLVRCMSSITALSSDTLETEYLISYLSLKAIKLRQKR
jgi:hypothetical protein